MKNKQRTTKESSVMAELREIRRQRNQELLEDEEGFFKRLAEFRKQYSEEHGVVFIGADD